MAESITNYISVTNTITTQQSIASWQDPSLWISLIVGIATLASAFLMWKSVNEMKLQRQLEYQKLDLAELRAYIDKNIRAAIDETETHRDSITHLIDIAVMKESTRRLYDNIQDLLPLSYNTVYEKPLNALWESVREFSCVVKFPEQYSDDIIRCLFMIFTRLGKNLYHALMDRDIFMELSETISGYKKMLYNNLSKDELLIFKEQQALENKEFQAVAEFYKSIKDKP